VGFFSKALSSANQKMSTYEKEFIAVLMAVDKWRPYLLKRPFIIRTNYKSMCHLQDQSLSIEMQRKTMYKLESLQFKLIYKKGFENSAIDALSRVAHYFQTTTISVVVPVWIKEIVISYTMDTEAQKLLQELVVVSPNAIGYSL
jgi:cysteinyl-tRNA synthetase